MPPADHLPEGLRRVRLSGRGLETKALRGEDGCLKPWEFDIFVWLRSQCRVED